MDWQSEIALNGLAYLIVSAAGAAAVGLALAVQPRLLRELRLRELRAPDCELNRTWNGIDVLAVFVLLILCSGFGATVLESLGFFSYWFEQTPSNIRKTLYGSLIDLPVFLALALLYLFHRADIRPDQTGLTVRRWPHNLMLGYLGFALATPIVLGIFFVASLVLHSIGAPVQHHAMEDLPNKETLPAHEWGLIWFRVSVVAPIMEEFFFRGVLFGWLPRATGLHALVLLALAALGGAGMIAEKSAENFTSLTGLNGGPPAFAALLALGYVLLLTCLTRSGKATVPGAPGSTPVVAVYGSAMLWGMSHYIPWPSPIPLFIMGLGLGSLACRTQSLMGPIVWHSLFNCVAFLVLVLQHA